MPLAHVEPIVGFQRGDAELQPSPERPRYLADSCSWDCKMSSSSRTAAEACGPVPHLLYSSLPLFQCSGSRSARVFRRECSVKVTATESGPASTATIPRRWQFNSILIISMKSQIG